MWGQTAERVLLRSVSPTGNVPFVRFTLNGALEGKFAGCAVASASEEAMRRGQARLTLSYQSGSNVGHAERSRRLRASAKSGVCAALLALASACSNTPTSTNPLANTGAGTGTQFATAGTGTVTPSGTAGTGTLATAGTGTTTTGTAGAGTVAAAGVGAPASAGTGAAGKGTAGTVSTGTAGTVAAAGGTGAAGAGGSTGAGVALKDCKAEDGTTDPCGTYTTAVGTTTPGRKVQLGPLGGQMDKNVGKGFENTVASADMDRTPASCQSFVDLFQQDKLQSSLLLDVRDLDFALFSVYRPANWEEGKTYPILTWGNGTCAMPEGYGALLRYIASYGYVIFAANSRQVSDLTITPKPMVRALDFAFAANEDAKSPYYHKLDTTKVAALGHSQGGAAAVATARDMRVNAAIIFNGGTSASKPFLAMSGERDVTVIAGADSSAYKTAVNAAPKAAYLYFHMVPMTGQFDGHLTLMLQPERVGEPSVQFLNLLLNKDPMAKEWFVGSSCKLCNKPDDFEFGQHGLE